MESQWGVKGLWGSEPAGRPSPSAGRIQGGWPQGPRPQAAGSESAGPQGGLCSWARGCLSLTQCGFYTLRVGEGPGITESACSPPPPPSLLSFRKLQQILKLSASNHWGQVYLYYITILLRSHLAPLLHPTHQTCWTSLNSRTVPTPFLSLR